jgi:hypothetical protein
VPLCNLSGWENGGVIKGGVHESIKHAPRRRKRQSFWLRMYLASSSSNGITVFSFSFLCPLQREKNCQLNWWSSTWNKEVFKFILIKKIYEYIATVGDSKWQESKTRSELLSKSSRLRGGDSIWTNTGRRSCKPLCRKGPAICRHHVRIETLWSKGMV